MAMKSITLIAVLVVVLVATQAEAELNLSLTPNIPLANITGNVSCSVTGTGLLAFPNALVQVRCLGLVVGSAITNATGGFSIIVSGPQAILSNLLLSACSVNVVTPLANCNATLPSTGFLQAPLQSVGNITVGAIGTIANLIPGIFSLIGA